MDHIAIMRKNWHLIEKLLAGTKTVETRWSVNKVAPWNKVSVGDTVYFKNAGEPVIAKATVSQILQFQDLTVEIRTQIASEYARQDGLSAAELLAWGSHKNYCTIVHLINSQLVTPFHINKAGFGSAAAWLAVNDVNSIKK